MYAIISPAKKLDFESAAPTKKFTQLRFQEQSLTLIKALRKCSKADISKLMRLSDSLAELNFNRYKSYKKEFTEKNSKQAIYAFKGDTYIGFAAETLSSKDIDYAQKHLGILSGLYGLVRPLDLIQPYRLEMGTKFPCNDAKNLYQYWGETITGALNKKLTKEKVLINLSSQEYFSSIKLPEVKGRVITPVFKEKKGDTYKVIGFSAKRARGMMARYIVENQIEDPESLKDFKAGGYKYSKKMSKENEYCFIRNKS